MTFIDEEERILAHNTVAYLLWEQAGKPEGQSEHFWFEAEKMLAEKWGHPMLINDWGEYVWASQMRGPKVVHFAPVVLEPESFKPPEGILTRYGKKIVAEGAKYYKKITLRG